MFKWVAKYTSAYVNINERESEQGAPEIEHEYVADGADVWTGRHK